MSRGALNLLLSALLLAGLTAVYLLQTDERSEQTASSQLEGQTRFKLQNSGGSIEFVREGRAWLVEKPHRFPANEQRVKMILAALAKLPEPYMLDQEKLAQYGLDTPRARLWLDGKEWQLGGVNPINQRRYLRQGGELYLLDGNAAALWASGWARFVEPLLLPAGAEIKNITIPGLGVVTRNDHAWWLNGELPTTSQDGLNRLIDNWHHARAFNIQEMVSDVERAPELLIEFAGGEPPLRFSIVYNERQFVLFHDSRRLEYHMLPEQGERLLKLSEL